MRARTSARPMAKAASPARLGRLRSDEALRWLLRDYVLEGRPREYREDRVVQQQEEQEALTVLGYCCADAPHDQRDGEGKDEERQENFSGSSSRGHRGHERADRADADVGEEDGCERGRVERLEEEDERRQRHCLGREQERERRERLPEPDRTAVARRE